MKLISMQVRHGWRNPATLTIEWFPKRKASLMDSKGNMDEAWTTYDEESIARCIDHVLKRCVHAEGLRQKLMAALHEEWKQLLEQGSIKPGRDDAIPPPPDFRTTK